MNPSEFSTLYQKYKKGNCSVEEAAGVEDYIRGIDLQEGPVKPGNEEELILARIRQRVHISLGWEQERKFRRLTIRYCAAAVLLITTGLAFFFHQKTVLSLKKEGRDAFAAIVPGTIKATLTRANGSRIILNEIADEQLARETQGQEHKIGGELRVDGKNAGENPDTDRVSIPRGGFFKVVLSDGTKVWLNAASSLSYPVRFTGAARHVSLHGEAYFEVAKDALHPFLVSAGQLNVRVLGTHFNIKAYDHEPVAAATLLEGAVNLSSKKSTERLVPGQQGVLKNHEFRIAHVNTDTVVAWKNGYFMYKRQTLGAIMNDMSRWYDVQVMLNGQTDTLVFSGKISRSKSLETILKTFKTTGQIDYKVEERRIIIMP